MFTDFIQINIFFLFLNNMQFFDVAFFWGGVSLCVFNATDTNPNKFQHHTLGNQKCVSFPFDFLPAKCLFRVFWWELFYFPLPEQQNQTTTQRQLNPNSTYLFTLSLIKQISQAVCVHVPGTVLPNHTVPRQNRVSVCKGSSSSGCVVSEVQPCFTTNLPAVHKLHTCQAPLSFHTCCVQAGINSYWFCTNTEVMVLVGEKPVCSPLLFTNSTQPEGEDALLYANNHLMCYFAFLTLKSLTLPPKCHCCSPFRCRSSTISNWKEIS